MARKTGEHHIAKAHGEEVRAVVPSPLPPADPPLLIDAETAALLDDARTALAKLDVAGSMVPNTDWFLYGFVRKEAVATSQIEGTQATLGDVLTFEATSATDKSDDVKEVCNYFDAIAHARAQPPTTNTYRSSRVMSLEPLAIVVVSLYVSDHPIGTLLA